MRTKNLSRERRDRNIAQTDNALQLSMATRQKLLFHEDASIRLWLIEALQRCLPIAKQKLFGLSKRLIHFLRSQWM